MKIQLNKSFFITVALLIATATLAHYSALWRMKGTTGDDDVATEKKPLYWVAPMDPNYKRDNPGNVSYTHLRAHETREGSRMPSSA